MPNQIEKYLLSEIGRELLEQQLMKAAGVPKSETDASVAISTHEKVVALRCTDPYVARQIRKLLTSRDYNLDILRDGDEESVEMRLSLSDFQKAVFDEPRKTKRTSFSR